jgi:lipoprotein NlpI
MPRLFLAGLLLPFLCLQASGLEKKDKKDKVDPLTAAKAAADAGNFDKALPLCDEAVKANAKSSAAHYLRGFVQEKLGKNQEALTDFSKALELEPTLSEAYHQRGCVQFKLGKFSESVADFDRYLEKNPLKKPGHWQRGISCYYAGKFEEGKLQFEGYQTTDSNDVENAVWRFMCQAKKDDVAKCRKDMLKIGNDERVPMKEVYDLFMGKIEPKDVLAAAKDRKAAKDQDPPLFYAHLYLGLYFETMGDKKQALEHLGKATDDFALRRYMWDVARVHRDVLRRELDKK